MWIVHILYIDKNDKSIVYLEWQPFEFKYVACVTIKIKIMYEITFK
jgi:hypothetical protein